ncbi:MAG: CAP domain-containing protein [Lachnospiraceae bacterium]|nr:CAP domain-containing protein [Lachnospiraceae bacterium]
MKKLSILWFTFVCTLMLSFQVLAADVVTIDVPITVDYDAEQEFIRTLNKARTEKGLNELPMNSFLMQEAELRAAEIILDLAHGHPDRRVNDYSFAEASGSMYLAGECLAANRSSSGEFSCNQFLEETTNGHSASMLCPTAQACGVGIVNYRETTYVCYKYVDKACFVYPYTYEDMKNDPFPTSGKEDKLYKIDMLRSNIEFAVGEVPQTGMEYGDTKEYTYVYIQNAYKPVREYVLDWLRIPASQVTITGDEHFTVSGNKIKANSLGTG